MRGGLDATGQTTSAVATETCATCSTAIDAGTPTVMTNGVTMHLECWFAQVRQERELADSVA
jgi:hypothetical protein